MSDEIIDLLKPLADYDKHYEFMYKSLWYIFIFLMIVFVAGYILSIIFLKLSTGIYIIIPIILIALIILQFKLANKIDLKMDVPDPIRKVIYPFLQDLVEKMKPEDVIELKIDVQGPVDSKTTHESPDKTQRSYKDYWFSGKASLADNSILSWELEDSGSMHVTYEMDHNGTKWPTFHYNITRLIKLSLTLQDGKVFSTSKKLNKSDNNWIWFMEYHELAPILSELFVKAGLSWEKT